MGMGCFISKIKKGEDKEMSEFDKIIGYDSIKEELGQLCDMIQNMEIYEKIGAKMPKGLLIHGVPGVGKSLMARLFIKESGRKAYIIRRNKPDGDFVNEIKNVFTEAAQNTPSIILLDDMDKFVVEENSREEYVAVQSCIDDVTFSDVYVLATANELYSIPDSLLRAGRFDRKIYVDTPQGEDAVKIIRHYITSKAVESDIDIEDIAKMLHGKSCAEFETILNEAAIYAGYERCEKISMAQFVRSFLRNEYGISDFSFTGGRERLEEVAYHEAGHIVVSEVLNPGGIGLASLRTLGKGEFDGFTVRCSEWNKTTHDILMSLAGKAAAELRYGVVDEGAASDLARAVRQTVEGVASKGICGIGGLDVFDHYRKPSDVLRAKQENLVHAEIERYLSQAKELLSENQEFLDAVVAALLEKSTLLNSDIKRIRESYIAKK
jgi:cell division protease FtsH